MDISDTTFYSQCDLLDRLTSDRALTSRKIAFLVGAPLAAPDTEQDIGVPGVDGIVGLIREELSGRAETNQAFEEALKKPGVNVYQEAFKFLLGRRGQDCANQVIQRAVLNARYTKSDRTQPLLSDDKCLELERDLREWHIPRGLDALTKIAVDFPTFGKVILTTNFDPLISLGIAKHGGRSFRSILDRDGSLFKTHGDGSHIVHLHGYWYGCDTLHTPRQLNQLRPQLKSSLAHLLNNTTVVVLAYGGWDDIFTKTLMEVVDSDSSHPEIIWTFREADESAIRQKYANVLKNIGPGLDRARVTAFKGIEANYFLQQLLSELTTRFPPAAVAKAVDGTQSESPRESWRLVGLSHAASAT